MKKENNIHHYFAYMINELEKRQIEYNTIKIQRLMYLAKAYSLSFHNNGLSKLKFQAHETGPMNIEFKNELIYNFILGISAYKNYYIINNIKQNDENIILYIVENFADITNSGLDYLLKNDVFQESSPTPWMKTASSWQNNKIIKNKDIKSFYSKDWFNAFIANKKEISSMLL